MDAVVGTAVGVAVPRAFVEVAVDERHVGVVVAGDSGNPGPCQAFGLQFDLPSQLEFLARGLGIKLQGVGRVKKTGLPLEVVPVFVGDQGKPDALVVHARVPQEFPHVGHEDGDAQLVLQVVGEGDSFFLGLVAQLRGDLVEDHVVRLLRAQPELF